MPTLPRNSFVEIAKRWLALAEQRRAHLVELYDSGRWRHYYSEAQLLERTREAILLEETWAKLAYPEGLPHAETAPAEPKEPAATEPAADDLVAQFAKLRRAG